MKLFLLRNLTIFIGFAGLSPAVAQENWAGVEEAPTSRPGSRLVGNEYLVAQCNNGYPEFACAGGSDITGHPVPLREFARSTTVNALGRTVAELAELTDLNQRDGRQGIAAAISMGSASMPSAPGRTSYAFNLATFRGQQALGGSMMHRLSSDVPLAVSVGFSVAGDRNNAARIGVAGEF